MTPFELLTCAVLIAISSFMSSSEIALFSLSRFQVRSLKERVRPSLHKKVKKVLGDPGGLLITILVVNEIVNVSLSSLIAGFVSRSRITPPFTISGLPGWAIDVLLGTLITAPIVLFACEITPKVVGARANLLVASLTAEPLYIIYQIFQPIRLLLRKILTEVSRRVGRTPLTLEPEKKGSILKEADFLLMIEEGRKEGAIQEKEFELIKKVFELDDTTVSEILTPFAQVHTLSSNTTLKSALNAIRSQNFSRIPITSANRKEIVGILYAKDLLRAKLEIDLMSVSVTTLMKKPLFVSVGTRLNSVFRKFKQQKTHMAVVKDGRGETLGVVTMSDVLDALFEDILSEEDDSGTESRGSAQ